MNKQTIREVALSTGISRFTIQKAIRDDAFPVTRAGNNYLIDTDLVSFKRWVQGTRPRNTTKSVDGFVHGTFTLSGDRKKRLAALVGSSDKEALIEAARQHLYEWIDGLPLA